jgi:hypothetical protein
MAFFGNIDIGRSIVLRDTVGDVVADDAGAALNSVQDVQGEYMGG